MERDELRLECIKLAATRTTDQKDALARAEEYFWFVMRPPDDSAKVVPLKPTGNTSQSVGVTVGTGRQPTR